MSGTSESTRPEGEARAEGVEWEHATANREAVTTSLLPQLHAPAGLAVRPGRGQVTLDWEPVDGAAGYLVRRAVTPDGPFEPIEIGEPWVRPVPHPPLTDTTGDPGVVAWYTVAAVAAVDDRSQPESPSCSATPELGGSARCTVAVRAGTSLGSLPRPWRAMIGSERLSQLDAGVGPGGRHIGDEFAEALRLAHDELGVRAVRAHAILHDDLGVYRQVDGRPVHDFTGVDRIYDRVLSLGLHPVVEVSFMPHDLARDPSATVFHYGAIVSPPSDWDRWGALVADLADHLVARYGRDEVRGWGFEVWNEANLDVFWAGSRDEYFQLYDVTAAAIKSVDRSLLVGGPASAAAAWIDETLEHSSRAAVPIDFLSTHSYGNAPLDLRPIAARHGRAGLPLWWTEWGAHATHFDRAHDSVWSAAYLVRGMVSAMGRIDALAYWTVSDHFEELGRAPSLLHGGFGLLGIGNLRKPRWWGLWMLEQLGQTRVHVDADGDGAGDMVGAVATRDDRGSVAVVIWNGTVDVGKCAGDALLDRSVTLVVDGLAASEYEVRHRRLDREHGDIGAAWTRIAGDRDWPDEHEWGELSRHDHLPDLRAPARVRADRDTISMTFELPMPSVSLVELTPV